MLDYALIAFTSLFTVMNPIGIAPVFIGMTTNLTRSQRRATARRAVLTSFGVLMLFGLTGRFLFEFFGISVAGMRVVGGIILFGIGYEMLGAKLSRTKAPTETVGDYIRDISITPLAIPIMTGPGAIATIIVLANDGGTVLHYLVLAGVVALVVTVIYLVLMGGERMLDFIGEDGNSVLLRIMGLILMVLGVEFIIGGLTPILREMFMLGS